MQKKIQVRRGTKANLPSLDDGEPGWVEDNLMLYMGQSGTSYPIGGFGFGCLQNYLPNSGFGVWSMFYNPVQMGTAVTGTWATNVAQDYVTVTTTNTQGLAVGKIINVTSIDAGEEIIKDSPHMVYALTANVSFSFYMHSNKTTVGASGTTFTCYEVNPGTANLPGVTDACDGWNKSQTLELDREWASEIGTAPEGTHYCVRMVKGSDDREAFLFLKPRETSTEAYGRGQDPVWVNKFVGKTVSFGAWVYPSSAHIHVVIGDGVTESVSTDGTTADGTWHWIEISHTISSSATKIIVEFYIDGTTSQFAWVCNPMFTFGPVIGEGNYRPVPNEIITLDSHIIPRNWESEAAFGGTTANAMKMRIESETGGQIPRGVRMIGIEVEGTPTTAGDIIRFYRNDDADSYPSTQGPILGAQVNSINVYDYGQVAIEIGAEDWFYIFPGGSGTWTVSMNICQVYL